MADRPHLTINRRHVRVQQLLGHVLHAIGKHLPDEAFKRVARELEELFHVTGAYILTDADRAAAGLPMRGVDGLTLDELRIIEAKMIEAMLAPAPRVVVDGLDMVDTANLPPGHITWMSEPSIRISRPGTYRVTREADKLVCETIADVKVVNRPPPPGS